jgi:tRNA pseudouridine32 synthase/23S rRNA pseudouridine746 synthase
MHDPALVWFDPPPPAELLPARFASPFDAGAPHPLARRAADQLIDELRGRRGRDALDAPGGGKMFGVLVVAAPDGTAHGRIGYLRGFSGMLDGSWYVPGFVPPLFDAAARASFWPAGERRLAELDRALRELDAAPEHLALRVAQGAMLARHGAELAALRGRHRDQRAARHAARDAIRGDRSEAVLRAVDLASAASHAADRAESIAALHALDQASRGDAAERRRMLALHAAEHDAITARLDALDRARGALARERVELSRALTKQLHDGYAITSFRGERRPLRALFAPGEPPSGAGDCAGPKLLGHAYRLGLVPLALAELWWGAPPTSGGRRAGQLYPSCRGKCGPLLPFQLDGLPLAAAPKPGAAPVASDQPRIVFDDDWLVVVDKPCGLLSVPGRDASLCDSVVTRLRARWPGATAVHRLDLDASGLLVVAKDPATHTALQGAFARREVDKRYVAWLDGPVTGDAGTIALALRVDLDDRPRQLVDPVHGKPAITDWRVIARSADRTRVHLVPRTGRSHQLRVHAAHPLGLGAPIVGDRLYGRAAARLALHAEALAFLHPHTQRRIALEQPAPF